MKPVIFYDGDCGFCDRSVQWVARHDREQFDFAPLGGPTFMAHVPEAVRRELPDTIVVVTESARALIRGQAARYVLQTMGGPWRALALLIGALPASLVDRGYDWFARHRHRVAPELCGIPSPALRKRLLP